MKVPRNHLLGTTWWQCQLRNLPYTVLFGSFTASALTPHLSERPLLDLGDEFISAGVSHALAKQLCLKVDAIKIPAIGALSNIFVDPVEVP